MNSLFSGNTFACQKNNNEKSCPILFVLYTHPVSEIVSYHSPSHHSLSDDSQLYKSGNVSQLPEIIHSTRSCISDVKVWVTNNQLQLNNDKTEMIPVATKTVLNSDSVPQSINLEGSGIKLANTVRNLGVCLDPTLSCNSKSPPCVVYAIWNFVGLVKIRHSQSEDVTKRTIVCICSFKDRFLQLVFGGLS